jgi:hypothetical protein
VSLKRSGQAGEASDEDGGVSSVGKALGVLLKPSGLTGRRQGDAGGRRAGRRLGDYQRKERYVSPLILLNEWEGQEERL